MSFIIYPVMSRCHPTIHLLFVLLKIVEGIMTGAHKSFSFRWASAVNKSSNTARDISPILAIKIISNVRFAALPLIILSSRKKPKRGIRVGKPFVQFCT